MKNFISHKARTGLLFLFFGLIAQSGWGQNTTVTINPASITSTTLGTGYSSGAEKTWTQSSIGFGGKAISCNTAGTPTSSTACQYIQAQAANGVIYNTGALPGRIVSIQFTGTASVASSCFGGTSRLVTSTSADYVPGGTQIGTAQTNTTYTWSTAASDNYTFFCVKRGTSSQYFSSIVVIYQTPVAVTFNANSGTGSMSAQTAGLPTNLTSNTFTRIGYTFSGWNTAANGSGTAYANTASFPFTSATTLYAQWTATTTTPAAPTIGTITPGYGQLSVAFTAGSDGGASITDYKWSVDGTTYTTRAGTTSPIVITGLTNGTAYTVRIRAVNAAGDGSVATASAAATPATTPSAPTITSITPGNLELSVAFSAGSDGGSAITNYKYSTDGGSSFTAVSPAATTSPITITGLTNGTTYDVQIKAVNAQGDGSATATTQGTPTAAAVAPGAPTITSITPSNGQLSVAFTAGATGGSAITNYKYSTDGGATFTAVTPSATTSPITISGLINGTTYYVQIKAVNDIGDGTATVSSAGTPATTPSAPTITGITSGNAQLLVAFTAGASGGTAITNYQYSTDGGSTFTAVSPAANTSPITITGLSNGVSYNVQIKAVNAIGDGTATASAAGTPATTPGAPTIVIAAAGNGQATVTFTSPVSNGGSAITSYTATSTPGSITGTLNQAGSGTITVTGLTNGTAYTFTVKANNAAGASSASAASNSVTPALTAPNATAATSILANGFTANWDAVTNATGYKLDVSTSNPIVSTSFTNVVSWDFPVGTTTSAASGGITANNTKTLTTNATGAISYSSTSASTLAALVNGWDAGSSSKYWQVDFTTTGYYNVRVSSAQRSSNTGPRDFKLQYKIGSGGAWADVTSGTITTAVNFTTGVLSAVSLPSVCDNQSSVFLRWIMTSNTSVNSGTAAGTGSSSIDDILIEGNASSYVSGYQDLTVSGTSQSVTSLTENTTYYYRVRATDASSTSANSNVITVTTKQTPTVTPTVGSYTYSGTAQGPNAATNTGTGSTYTFSYSGTGATTYGPSSNRPTAAGTYTVTASVAADGNYVAANSSATAFSIAKAALSVTAVDKSKTYDGAIYSGGYTSTISGFVNSESVSVVSGAATYSGTAISATNAGTYTITPAVGTLAASNYSFSFTNGTLTISKDTPTLSISNSPQTYSGSQIAATVTGSVAGTVSNVKYGGSATVPTNAGTYAITANLVPTDGTNYSSLTDASAGDFVISKATPTLSVTNTPVTYDGLTHAATATASGDGTVSNILTGGAATQTNAGTYTVTADIAASSNYIAASGVTASNSFVISKASSSITVTGSTSFVYSGSAQGPATSTVTGSSGAVSYSFSGVSPTVYATSATAPTNVGSYTVIASVAADSNYEAASSSATAFGIVYPTNNWTGAISTSWNNTSNWSLSSVPLSTDNITISTGSPVMDVNHTIDAGRTLTISGTGTLTINPNKILTIAGTADFGGKSVILKSDATGDGAIGQVNGTLSNPTNVTVERYIPAKRAWRALTAPLKGSNTSLYASWQNGGTAVSPYNTGIELWGPSGTGMATGPAYNIRQYTTSGWADVTNTQSANLFTSGSNNAYLVFVTGGYGSNNIGNGQSAATTLKATGQLITGPVSFAMTSARHTLVGNPFASPISPSAILAGNTQANLYTNIWLWDPAVSTNGVYVNYDASVNSGTFSDNSGSYTTSSTAIQSGQAFFVKAVAGTDTLTLTESMKSSSVSNTFRNNNNITASVVRLGFAKQIGTDWMPLDGAIAALYNNANAAVDVADGTKMVNTSENIAFVRGMTNLSIEHYPLVNATDQLNVKIWNTQQAHYKLKLNTEEFTMAGVEAYLQDLYTGTTQPLNLDGSVQDYEFDVDPTVSASSGNRFRIVFTNTALAVTHPEQGQLSIYPNPATGGKVTVSLPTGTFEGCSYELINVLGQVVRQDEITNSNSSQVLIPLTGLPNSWYALRIRKDNKVVYQGKLIINN